jgi:hypothetical protein
VEERLRSSGVVAAHEGDGRDPREPADEVIELIERLFAATVDRHQDGVDRSLTDGANRLWDGGPVNDGKPATPRGFYPAAFVRTEDRRDNGGRRGEDSRGRAHGVAPVGGGGS